LFSLGESNTCAHLVNQNLNDRDGRDIAGCSCDKDVIGYTDRELVDLRSAFYAQPTLFIPSALGATKFELDTKALAVEMRKDRILFKIKNLRMVAVRTKNTQCSENMVLVVNTGWDDLHRQGRPSVAGDINLFPVVNLVRRFPVKVEILQNCLPFWADCLDLFFLGRDSFAGKILRATHRYYNINDEYQKTNGNANHKNVHFEPPFYNLATDRPKIYTGPLS